MNVTTSDATQKCLNDVTAERKSRQIVCLESGMRERDTRRNAVEKVYQCSVSKTCSLQPSPLWSLKSFYQSYYRLSHECALRLYRRVFCHYLRNAFVTPRLKKPRSDASDVKNYQPISNLSFMSKVVERHVCKQLVYFLEKHNLLPKYKLTYKRYHSTEILYPMRFHKQKKMKWRSLAFVWHSQSGSILDQLHPPKDANHCR